MRISDWSSDVCSSDLRTGRCDVAEDVATALAQAREDALREAAGKCDEMARSAERSRAAAALAGSESVASRRHFAVATAEALAGDIRDLITHPRAVTNDCPQCRIRTRQAPRNLPARPSAIRSPHGHPPPIIPQIP